jgi:hypothetical protein
MASLSREYLIQKGNINNTKKKATGLEKALDFGTSVDLTPLLIVTKKSINRLPIFHMSEGKA